MGACETNYLEKMAPKRCCPSYVSCQLNVQNHFLWRIFPETSVFPSNRQNVWYRYGFEWPTFSFTNWACPIAVHTFFLHVLFKEWVCVSSILGTWCGKQTARQEAGYLTEVCRCNKLYVTINIFIHVFNLQKSRRKKSHCNLSLCCEGYLFIPSTAAAITIKLVCGRISSWL